LTLLSAVAVQDKFIVIVGEEEQNKMDPVHDVNFVSCEDILVKPSVQQLFNSVVGSSSALSSSSSSSPLSIHNAACTVTGFIIFALVPWNAVRTASTLPPISLSSSSSKGIDKTNRIKNNIFSNFSFEITAYLLALTYLFYANLHQHTTGFIYWDLDVGGAIHSIFLSLMVYENCKHHTPNNKFVPQLKTSTARAIAIIATVVELITPLIRPKHLGRQIAASVGGIAALTVVPFLGYQSWIKRSMDGGNSFIWWLVACAGVKTAEWLVVVEQSMCPTSTTTSTPLWVQRYFHATIIHAEIALLFVAVSQCAFGVIRNHRLSLSTSENKNQSMKLSPGTFFKIRKKQ